LGVSGAGDQRSEMASTAVVTDFERVTSDLTGSMGAFSESHKLKLFSD